MSSISGGVQAQKLEEVRSDVKLVLAKLDDLKRCQDDHEGRIRILETGSTELKTKLGGWNLFNSVLAVVAGVLGAVGIGTGGR